MQRWQSVVVLGVLGLVLAGCEEPPPFETPVPPGGFVDRVPASERGDQGPQALGETVAPKKREEIAPAKPTAIGESKTTATGLKYETLKEGTGDEVKSGQTVVMSYVGKLDDGTIFDQSRPDKPFETVIGMEQVIKGWDQGVVGMRVGERRKLIIPPDLAYAAQARDKIPANSRLTFEVELLKIK